MNSRNSGDHELPSGRVSARSRYSAPPSAAFSGAAAASTPFDWGTSSTSSGSSRKSKGGINGRGAYEDDDDELQGLNSRSMLRNAAKRTNSSGGSVSSAGSGAAERERLNGSGPSLAHW